MFDLLRNHTLDRFRHIAVIHTGGTPGLFAYREKVAGGYNESPAVNSQRHERE